MTNKMKHMEQGLEFENNPAVAQQSELVAHNDPVVGANPTSGTNKDHVAQLDSAMASNHGQEHRTSNSGVEGSSPSVVANDLQRSAENGTNAQGTVVSDAQRQAALDALTPWIDKYKTGPLFEDDKGRVLILKKHLYNFIECYELAQNIREALQSQRVPEIEGLEDALKKYSFDMPDMSDYESVGHYLDDIAEYRKASSIVEKAARAYYELQKGGLR